MKWWYRLRHRDRYHRLYDDLARELRAGDHASAVRTATECVALGERCFGPENAELVAPLYALASSYLAGGRYSEAARANDRATSIAEHSPSEPAPHQLLEQRAAIADRADDATAFEAALQRIIEVGPDAPRATAHNRLGLHLGRAGRFADAHRHFGLALALREATTGDDLSVAEVLHNRATFRDPDATDVEARQRDFERALDITKRHLTRPASALEARIAHNLAVLLQERLDDDGALLQYQHALQAFERDHDASDPALRPTLARYGRLLQANKRFDDAVPILRRAHRIAVAELGEAHEITGQLALWLGDANSHTFR